MDRPVETPVRPFKGYEKKTGTHKYTVICLTLIGIFLVGTGIALVIVGNSDDIPDLIIIGTIFLLAGVGFTIMMCVIIARPIYNKKLKQVGLKEKEKKSKGKKTLDTCEILKPYIPDQEKKIKEANDFHKRKNPSEKDLYWKTNKLKPPTEETQPPGVVLAVSEEQINKNNSNSNTKLKSDESPYSQVSSDTDNTETLKSAPVNELYNEVRILTPEPVHVSNENHVQSNLSESPLPSVETTETGLSD